MTHEAILAGSEQKLKKLVRANYFLFSTKVQTRVSVEKVFQTWTENILSCPVTKLIYQSLKVCSKAHFSKFFRCTEVLKSFLYHKKRAIQ